MDLGRLVSLWLILENAFLLSIWEQKVLLAWINQENHFVTLQPKQVEQNKKKSNETNATDRDMAELTHVLSNFHQNKFLKLDFEGGF